MAANTGLISAANNAFGLNLFKVMTESGGEQNVFLSPFSLSTALAMTHLGARNKTATEMARVLQWNVQDENKLHEQYQAYISVLQTPTEEFQLSTANRIYIENNYPIISEFKEKIMKLFFAEPVNSDFKHNADGERVKINTWVEEQTQSKIKDLLTKGTVKDDTRFILVNAVYFKCNWDKQFNEIFSKPMTFKIAPGQSKNVSMMNETGMYAIVADPELKCRALEILYKGKNFGMVIILPNEEFGLRELVEKLTPEKLDGLLKKLGPNSEDGVELSLPRFEIEYECALKESLYEMGMKDAFCRESADFKAMSDYPEALWLSDVIHKAVLQVNECGTVAAAATAISGILEGGLACTEPKMFIVDHPFLLAIRDRRAQGTVLFFGSVCNP